MFDHHKIPPDCDPFNGLTDAKLPERGLCTGVARREGVYGALLMYRSDGGSEEYFIPESALPEMIQASAWSFPWFARVLRLAQQRIAVLRDRGEH
jgi:hypothetical protein